MARALSIAGRLGAGAVVAAAALALGGAAAARDSPGKCKHDPASCEPATTTTTTSATTSTTAPPVVSAQSPPPAATSGSSGRAAAPGPSLVSAVPFATPLVPPAVAPHTSASAPRTAAPVVAPTELAAPWFIPPQAASRHAPTSTVPPPFGPARFPLGAAVGRGNGEVPVVVAMMLGIGGLVTGFLIGAAVLGKVGPRARRTA